MTLSWAHLFLLAIVVERGIHLVIARRNEIQIKKLGGEEYGASFTRVLVGFHVCWFISFGIEAAVRGARLLCPPALLIVVFLLFQMWRYWCILSLGRQWNTKIIVIPGAELIRTGPYRFFKHPNYIVVLLEIFVYPALFGCWITAFTFGLLNVFVLKNRIRQEEDALRI
jgi:methyltransferase